MMGILNTKTILKIGHALDLDLDTLSYIHDVSKTQYYLRDKNDLEYTICLNHIDGDPPKWGQEGDTIFTYGYVECEQTGVKRDLISLLIDADII